MYKFDKEIDVLDSMDQLISGLHLWIWNPSTKSPHLGISLDGHYYSLQHQSKQENLSVNILLNAAKRKKNSVLVIELVASLNKSRIKEVFAKYTSCDKDQFSCSKPLFDVFDIQKSDGILFDILESQKNSIISLKGIHLGADFRGIPMYTYADVLMNLNVLAS